MKGYVAVPHQAPDRLHWNNRRKGAEGISPFKSGHIQRRQLGRIAPLSRRAFLFYRRTPDIRVMGAGVGIGATARLLGSGAAGPVLLHVG
jgi:hypothetical protein